MTRKVESDSGTDLRARGQERTRQLRQPCRPVRVYSIPMERLHSDELRTRVRRRVAAGLCTRGSRRLSEGTHALHAERNNMGNCSKVYRESAVV
jgi:hypothetical protein